MLFDVILDFIFGVLGWLMDLLPKWQMPNLLNDTVKNAFGMTQNFLDLKALFTVINIIIGLFVALAIFHLVVWILKKIRILG